MRVALITIVAFFISSGAVLSDWDDIIDVGKEVYPITQRYLNKHLNECSIENGKSVQVEEGLVTRVKVGRIGEQTEVEIIDFEYVVCPFAYSMFCGSGGCNAAIATKEKIFFEEMHQWYSWELVLVGADTDYPETIIVTGKHGLNCGTYGANYCYVALRWDGEQFLYLK